jgi:protein gp37
LQAIQAAVRFLSIEPLLEPLGSISLAGIHWVIVGGESGPGARPMDEAWVCEAARRAGRIPVGTVFGEEEGEVVRAIDHYAAGHALADRSAVVREALAQLLRIDIRRQPSGQR